MTKSSIYIDNSDIVRIVSKSPEQMPLSFLATKSHKNSTANETLKAPIGARTIFLGMTKSFL